MDVGGVEDGEALSRARSDPTVSDDLGISMFAVEKGAPGLSVARPLEKMGWLCSDTAELVFEDCYVPQANLLGEEGRGFYAIMRNFQNERIALGAMALGEAGKALELTIEHVKASKQARKLLPRRAK